MDTLQDLGVEFGAWVHHEHRLWYEAWFFMRKNLYAFVGVFLAEPPLARAGALFLIALVLMGSQVTMQALSEWRVRLSYNVMAGCLVGVAAFEMMARAQEEEIARESTQAELWIRTVISAIALVPAGFVVMFYTEAILRWLRKKGWCTGLPHCHSGTPTTRRLGSLRGPDSGSMRKGSSTSISKVPFPGRENKQAEDGTWIRRVDSGALSGGSKGEASAAGGKLDQAASIV